MADGSLPIIVGGQWPVIDNRPAIVVGFAGGGGSSIAIEQALGVEPDAALNHWDLALRVHQVNFPGAEYHCADISETDCREVCPGRPIELLWLSPDCRHFSKAKGAALVSKRVRGLAWVAIPWAKVRRPRVIIIENVEEFLTWGPVGEDQKPIKELEGTTFRRWKSRLQACGYVVDHKVLSAADYGAPTIRKRLFIVARCDGEAIVWPEPSHAPRKLASAKGLSPYRGACEIIDWSRPCPSIFLSREEARAMRIKRPLEEATLRRIARGLFRYTIASADPFIVPVTHLGDERHHDVRDPLRTITAAPRGEFALVAPSMIRTDMSGAKRAGVNSAEDPLRTFTSAGGLAVMAAHVTKFRSGATGLDARDPLPTITANSHIKRPGCAGPLGVVSAILTGCGGRMGQTEPVDPRDPYPTITSKNDSALIAAYMEQANTGMVGHDARDPMSTIVGKGCTQRLIAAQLSQFRGSNKGVGDIRDPSPALTANGHHQALLEAVLEEDQPMAVPFALHDHELRAFLVKYYGTATAEDLADPLGTATSRARFGLVLVAGVAYRIVDIGMRMLDPETELAAAMGVPKGYVLGHDIHGQKVTKTAINKMVGNMVSPPPAAALIAANLPRLAERVAA